MGAGGVGGARTVLLIPEPLESDLARLGADWVASWVLDPFLIVTLGDGSVSDDEQIPDIAARIVGRDGVVEVDLVDELAERSPSLLRVVGVSVSDELLGIDGAEMRAEARRIVTTLERSSSGHNDVRPLNLVVAETRAAGLATAELGVGAWRASVMAAPENRTALTGFDAFVRASRPADFHGFVLAHAATLGGLWSGMSSGPFDASEQRLSGSPVLDLQRITIRGVLSQDFSVRMAESGLEPLLAEETPLQDPSLRSALGEGALTVIPEERVAEATALLAAYVMRNTAGRPLLYRPHEPEPEPDRDSTGPWAAIAGFAAFSGDKLRVLPAWTAWWFRQRFASSVERRLHGADEPTPTSDPVDGDHATGDEAVAAGPEVLTGSETVRWGRDPFGDGDELERDLAEAAAARQEARESLDQPLPVTLDGPDTYAHVWAALRYGGFLLLDADAGPAGAPLAAELAKRKLTGVLPRVSSLYPDPRDPWSPQGDVADLVAAEIGGEAALLPRTVGWLDLDAARAWHAAIGELERTSTDRVRAVDRALSAVSSARTTVEEALTRSRRDSATVEELLDLDEHDHGPVLDARIEVILAGVTPDVRARLVPATAGQPIVLEAPPAGPVDPVETAPDGDGEGDGDGGEGEGEGTDDGDADAAPTDTGDGAARHPAFDRLAAEAWAVRLEQEQQEHEERLATLQAEEEDLVAQREQLETVHPQLVHDAVAIRAWLWRLEESFAGGMVEGLGEESRRLERDLAKVTAELSTPPPDPGRARDLYGRFVRRFLLGTVLGVVVSALLWDPITSWLSERLQRPVGESVARVLGIPVWIVVAVVLLVLLGTLLAYHREWSRRRRALQLHRHATRRLAGAVVHLQAERLRVTELHRQAREAMRLMAEVIHRPFLLDGVEDALPSSRSIEAGELPKVLRLARPEITETWDGERRFVHRILRTELRRGWREEAYTQLLEAVQRRFGLVRGKVGADVLDRDPAARSALLEHLLTDEAQREVGVARVRSVIEDIAGWRVEESFPYPPVRVIRPPMADVDVRTDMFASGEEEPEEWHAFLGANVEVDERWAANVFATGHRGLATEIVHDLHAPVRFHVPSERATAHEPRPDEVRPVEFVIRIDRRPEVVAAGRVAAFSERIGDGGVEDDVEGAVGAPADDTDDADDEGVDLNF